jgi:hypothetical protein
MLLVGPQVNEVLLNLLQRFSRLMFPQNPFSTLLIKRVPERELQNGKVCL